MEQADISRFTEMLSNVYAFYQRDFSPFAGRVWIEAMRPFDFTAVAGAINRHVVNPDSGQFLPKPADIVKMLQGSTQDSGLVAWTEVDRAVRCSGPYGAPKFADPIIASVILDMGGWVSLNEKTEDEWPFIRNEFVNRYRGYKLRNDFPSRAPQLTGIADHHNRLEGFLADDDRPLLDRKIDPDEPCPFEIAESVIKRIGEKA
ncbi:DUF6475 domain-containing protein [Caballeronia sp. AZ10_KS36]|uniref:DUF6475 domain-containing protein n=1 Tax=Caballeronia sp. AZ10_KS36 TaxID=2921757 RepID=UPI002028D599|nr:DUF6475 domain-containing protein [Caballeronia sp. AZ10_KS36]